MTICCYITLGGEARDEKRRAGRRRRDSERGDEGAKRDRDEGRKEGWRQS